MKKLFLFLFILTFAVYADLSMGQIQNMVEKIHEKREGVKLKTLKDTKEPFVRFETEKGESTFVIATESINVKDVKLSLHAIMNGKAYINDSWMKPDESILGYQLKYIGKRGVVLRNENHIKKLFLTEQKDSLIKFEGR